MLENTFDKSKLIIELKNIHNELVDVYRRLFDYKYKQDREFKSFIDREYNENGISGKERKVWNDNFCHRASYTLLNKILFVRICEDKGFMLNAEDYIAGQVTDPHIGKKLSKIGLQKWANIVTNYTLGELVKFAFSDMKKSYKNIILYKEDKYEVLNPTDEELSLKYINRDGNTRKLVLEFEKVLQDIIEKLDTNSFNFMNTDGNILGDVYEKFMDRETRKAIGQFYTPEFVIEYILKNTIGEVDVVKNPFVRVADISCGSGHFLIMTYDILREKFISNLVQLREKYADTKYIIKRNGREEELKGTDYWQEKNIHYHLLKHIIFGADIDSFAVQLTTINLLLKDLDNFTDDLNIIECDSLTLWEQDYDWRNLKQQLEEEYEIVETVQINLLGENEKVSLKQKKENFVLKYKDSLGVNKEEKISKDAVEKIISCCELWDVKFDYIIGNPPYVRQEKIKNKAYLESRYSIYNSIADLLTYFIERGIKKLNPHGKLGFIISDKFTRANYGEKLRRFISENYLITHYKDQFNDVRQVFEDATVDSAIIIIRNEEVSSNNEFSFNDSTFKQSDLDNSGWYFVDQIGIKIKEKVDNLGTKIKNIKDIKINRGILTGLNDAFFIDINTKNELCIKDPKSEQIIKKLLRGRDIDQYSVNWQQLYLLNTGYDTDIENEYPAVYEYLCKFREKLEIRSDQGENWYNLRACTYYDDFEREKIIFANMAVKNRFYYDNEKYYTNQKAFILNSNQNRNLKYLSGLLNSNLLYAYFRWITPKLQGDTREYSKVFVNEVPLILNTEYEARIAELVEFMLTKEKEYEGLSVYEYYDYEKQLVKLKIEKQKAEININQMIYEMYQITPKEILYIENETSKSITFEKKKYLKDLSNGNCKVVFDYMSSYEEYFIDELEKLLPISEFINEHIEKDKCLDQIAEQFGFEYITVALLRERYANKYGDNQQLKFYNLSRFYQTIKNHILKHIIEILKEKQIYLSLENIRDSFKERYSVFENLIDIMRKDKTSKSSIEVIKEIMNRESITWDKFINEKKQNKVSSKIIKYETSKNYGLSEWSDEIHKKYFMDAIEEYTINNPNEKKARDILKLFNELDIEDKQDYIEIIESKINKTFN